MAYVERKSKVQVLPIKEETLHKFGFLKGRLRRTNLNKLITILHSDTSEMLFLVRCINEVNIKPSRSPYYPEWGNLMIDFNELKRLMESFN